MRAYRVVGKTTNGTTVTRFAGTQADARQTRDAIVNDTGLKKGEVDIEEVEIPTAKAELIEFINELVSPAT